MNVSEMIGVVLERNQLVRIWLHKVGWYDYVVWEGEANGIPEKYLNRHATIFGVYGMDRVYSNYINIRVAEAQNDECMNCSGIATSNTM